MDTTNESPLCVNVQHLQLDDAVCLVFGCGDILLQHLGTNAPPVECVGGVDVGIAAAAWAPDQELLAVVNCAGSLLVLTREFDVLTEAPIETDEFVAAMSPFC